MDQEETPRSLIQSVLATATTHQPSAMPTRRRSRIARTPQPHDASVTLYRQTRSATKRRSRDDGELITPRSMIESYIDVSKTVVPSISKTKRQRPFSAAPVLNSSDTNFTPRTNILGLVEQAPDETPFIGSQRKHSLRHSLPPLPANMTISLPEEESASFSEDYTAPKRRRSVKNSRQSNITMQPTVSGQNFRRTSSRRSSLPPLPDNMDISLPDHLVVSEEYTGPVLRSGRTPKKQTTRAQDKISADTFRAGIGPLPSYVTMETVDSDLQPVTGGSDLSPVPSPSPVTETEEEEYADDERDDDDVDNGKVKQAVDKKINQQSLTKNDQSVESVKDNIDELTAQTDLNQTENRDMDLNQSESRGTDFSEGESRDVVLNQSEKRGADLNQSESRCGDLNQSESRGADLIQSENRGAELNQNENRNVDINQSESRGSDLNQGKSTGTDSNQSENRNADSNQSESRDAFFNHSESRDAYFNQSESREVILNPSENRDVDLNHTEKRGADLSQTKSREDFSVEDDNISQEATAVVDGYDKENEDEVTGDYTEDYKLAKTPHLQTPKPGQLVQSMLKPVVSNKSQITENVSEPSPKAKPKQPSKKRDLPNSSLAPNCIKKVFASFCKMRVSKDTLPSLINITEQYFSQAAQDLEAFCEHAGRKTIQPADVELLMRRQGFVTDRQSLNFLVEKYLPLELREKIIPIARSGNRVVP